MIMQQYILYMYVYRILLYHLIFGNVKLWYGKLLSSTTCQCRTFILFISMRSRLSRMTRFEMKCLAVSIITPRQEKRGWSNTWHDFTSYWKRPMLA